MRIAASAVIAASVLILSIGHSSVASAATSKTKLATTTKPKTVPTSRTIAVEPGDYLYKIAGDTNTSIQRIYDANTTIENPDLIFPGQQLRIPDEKEVIAHRDMPTNSVVAQQVQAETQAAPVASYRAVTSSAPVVSDGSVWDQLAQCEAGGNWAINTGNGYYGGLQFTLSSWQGVGGSGYPNEASREEQIMRGQLLQARSGWGAGPACSARLGL